MRNRLQNNYIQGINIIFLIYSFIKIDSGFTIAYPKAGSFMRSELSYLEEGLSND